MKEHGQDSTLSRILMAGNKKMVVSVLAMAVLVQVVMGVDYPVGGPSGWETTTDLTTWSADKKFAPGDSLTFTYQTFHDVVEVSKADYDTCSGTTPIASYKGGSTTIKLTKPGKRYFICSVPGHCSAGMKLEVDVSSALAPSPAPAPLAVSPSLAPKMSPEIPSPSSTIADLPAVSAPTPSKITPSGAVGSTRWAQVALGLGLGLVMVLNL
ncbi:hypothetical protein LUZ60_001408 [Juncus effusus]|nr:hypothetical protein LUZ60_001408 [Juncus effusus]